MGELKTKRDSFRSRWGFILACVGSAVGMGNIWMFPYRVGQFGGAAYLIPYLLFVVLIGFTGVIGEMAFGRGMEAGTLGAFGKAVQRAGGKKKIGEAFAVIPVLGGFALAIGYSVVVGWIIKFLVGSITGSAFYTDKGGQYFGQLASDFGSVGWHILGLVITFSVMNLGISKGIEKANRIMMPLFFILFVVLAIRVMILPGALEGYRYLLIPEWSCLGDVKTWIYALGQAFFSLSLAGTGTVVYGSYLSRNEDIVKSARHVAVFDTIAAMLAAFATIPAAFVYGLDPASGPPMMFITMPEIFRQMPGGRIFMIVFFIAVLFASLTSLINLFETPIEALQYKFNLSRSKSVAIVAAAGALIGVCIEGNVGIWMDVCSVYIVPLGALISGIMFFWVCGKGYAAGQAQLGREKKIGMWFEPIGKYLFCGLTFAVLVLGIFYGGIG